MAEHGTLSRYAKGGCRCDLCREANRLHQRRQRRVTARPNPPDWSAPRPPLPESVKTHAACKGQPGDWWFPARGDVQGNGSNGGRSVRNPETLQALAICAACPVRQDCLDYAIEANEKVGIWGGTFELERRRLRRQRRLRRAVAVSTAGSAGQSPGRTPTAGPGSSTEKRWPREVRTSWSGDRIA